MCQMENEKFAPVDPQSKLTNVSHLLDSLFASLGASTASASCFFCGFEGRRCCPAGGDDDEVLSSSTGFSAKTEKTRTKLGGLNVSFLVVLQTGNHLRMFRSAFNNIGGYSPKASPGVSCDPKISCTHLMFEP